MLGLSVTEVLIVATTCLVTFYFYLGRNKNYWNKRGVANEPPMLLFGNIWQSMFFIRHFGQIITDHYEKFDKEKVVGFFNFNQQPGLIIRDPELVYSVLVTDFHSFHNNYAQVDPNLEPLLARNIFLQEDEIWKKTRALVSPAFSSGKIKTVYKEVDTIAQEFVEYLKKTPGDVHMKENCSRYLTEVIARSGFGIKGNSFTDEATIWEIGKLIFEPGFINGLKQVAFLFFPRLLILLKIRFLDGKVTHFFESFLADIIKTRQESNIVKNDMLNYWIELKKKTEEVARGEVTSDCVFKEFTNDDILAGCVSFFLENYETTAYAINNTFYMLALNPEVQNRLRAEIDEAWEQSKGQMSYEAMTNLKYLNCVMQETLRVMPIAYNMMKKCTNNHIMDIGNGKTLLVEAGTPIIIPIVGLSLDPNYWDNPKEFNPGRFEAGDPSPKGVFTPFSAGPRMCIGMRSAITNYKSAVFHVIRELEIVATERTPRKLIQEPKTFFLAHKGGIYAKFVPRRR